MSCHVNCFPKQCDCLPACKSTAMQFSVNYWAIMFLSLCGVSITFANLYILFLAVFIGWIWMWETQGGRCCTLPSLHLESENVLFYQLWKEPVQGFCNTSEALFLFNSSCLQGYTPLHIAALHGHQHILDLLIRTYGKMCLNIPTQTAKQQFFFKCTIRHE